MHGEEFLNDKFPELKHSKEVLHTSKGSKNKDEAIKKYMDRLESVHSKAKNKEHRKEILKQLYYRKYVVKEVDIPRYRDKEKIIKNQKESLDSWLDYLMDENARYPVWAKYWVFQGMLKIGNYDEANGVYLKRSKKTLAPFIEANPEVIARCISLVIEHVEKKDLNDDELKKLVASGNFQKLYTVLLTRNKNQISLKSDINDGKWITYNHETIEVATAKEQQGIEPEYLKLYNSLQGYNTQWCTAGGKEVAKNQICGLSGYVGGDFHVYYTKDENGNYKVPRIAIRMDRDDIGEIRGVADGQNIEDGLENIVEAKIKSFSNITESKIKKYLKIINDMKYLTLLNKKNTKKEEFTDEDIKFIYELERKIAVFGYENDPRIKKIIDMRDKEKDGNLLTKREDFINFWGKYFNDAPENIKNDKEIAIEAVKQDGSAIRYINSETEDYKEIAKEAVKQDGYAIRCINSETEGYKEIAMEAVKNYFRAMEYVSPTHPDYKDIAMEALKQHGLAINYISPETVGYKEMAMEALKQRGSVKYISPKVIQSAKITQTEILKIQLVYLNKKFFSSIKNKLKLCNNKFTLNSENNHKRR